MEEGHTLSPSLMETGSGNKSNGTDEGPIGDWIKAMTIPFYVLIFLIGVSGNSLVVYVVARNRAMQTITNIFITNLGIADIMMCLLAVPLTPLAAFLIDWPFGEVMCQIIPMSLAVSVFVSTLTSTAIAIDRYFVIVFPFKARMKTWLCLLLIVVIWVMSSSISMPLAIYRKIVYGEGDNRECGENWPDEKSRRFFTVTLFLLQYVVPCTIITYCYAKVSVVLKMRSRAKIGSGSKSREKEEIEIRRKRRTNKMLIAMISIFVGCWMPLNISLLAAEFYPHYSFWPYYQLIFFISHIIAMSSAIYNPFLYAWMNENFRKEFKQVLPCLFSGRKHTKLNGSMTQYSTVDTTINAAALDKTQQTTKARDQEEATVAGKNTHAHFDVDNERVQLKIAEDGVVADEVVV